jgi:hypothetical protein
MEVFAPGRATRPSGATTTCSSPPGPPRPRDLAALRRAPRRGRPRALRAAPSTRGRTRPPWTADVALAERLGVDGTPAFVVNGTPRRGRAALRGVRSPRAPRCSARRARGVMPDPSGSTPTRCATRSPRRSARGATATPGRGARGARARRRAVARGRRAAPVVLQVFSDFECPYCARVRAHPRRAAGALRRPAARRVARPPAAPPRPRAARRRGRPRGARAAGRRGLLALPRRPLRAPRRAHPRRIRSARRAAGGPMAETVHLYLKANGTDIKGESSRPPRSRGLDRVRLLRAGREDRPRGGLGHGDRSPAVRAALIRKRIDKSSPLIAKALVENNVIEAEFKFFRPNPTATARPSSSTPSRSSRAASPRRSRSCPTPSSPRPRPSPPWRRSPSCSTRSRGPTPTAA